MKMPCTYFHLIIPLKAAAKETSSTPWGHIFKFEFAEIFEVVIDFPQSLTQQKAVSAGSMAQGSGPCMVNDPEEVVSAIVGHTSTSSASSANSVSSANS